MRYCVRKMKVMSPAMWTSVGLCVWLDRCLRTTSNNDYISPPNRCCGTRPGAYRQNVTDRNLKVSLLACHIEWSSSRQPDSDSLLEPRMITVKSRGCQISLLGIIIVLRSLFCFVCTMHTNAARQGRSWGGPWRHLRALPSVGFYENQIGRSWFGAALILLLKLMPRGGDNGLGGVE